MVLAYLADKPAAFQLSQSETSAGSDLSVVLDSGSSDDGAESIDRSRGKLGGLRSTVDSSRNLRGSLVEVDLHPRLPRRLSEVSLLQGVVLSDSHGSCLRY